MRCVIIHQRPCPLAYARFGFRVQCAFQQVTAATRKVEAEQEEPCSPTETTSPFLNSKTIYKNCVTSTITAHAFSCNVLFNEKAIYIYIQPHIYMFTYTHVTKKKAARAFMPGLCSSVFKNSQLCTHFFSTFLTWILEIMITIISFYI